MTNEYIKRKLQIETRYWRKPIPTDSHDWEAGKVDWDFGDSMGFGRTEREAILDLMEWFKMMR